MAKSNKKTQKRIVVSKLKGTKLYWHIYRELGALDKKDKKTKNLTPAEKKKLVSETLFPKFKKEGLKSAKELKDTLKDKLGERFNTDECNPLFIPTDDLLLIPFYEIDFYIQKLPPCIDVVVNAGEYGGTGMFNTDNYNYYSNGVRDIVERIREEFGNESEDAPIFNGVVKLKENQKNKGKSENYFVEYILYIDDEPISDDTGVEFKLSKRQEKKKDEVQDILKAKIKKLKPEGEVLRKRKVKKEKEKAKKEVEIKPKTATESLSKGLQAIRGEEPKKQTNRLQSQLEKIRQQNK
jgi:hypothetical protein